MAEGSPGPTTCQVGLERTEQAYVAESWWLGCGNKRQPSLHEVLHPKITWRRSPLIRLSEMGWRESILLPLLIPLNEEVVEFVGHHNLFHVIDHLPVYILGAASPQLQSCSSGGNWQHMSLWVRAKDHEKPVIRPHVPARMPDLGLYMWNEVGHSVNTLELWSLQTFFLTRWCLQDLKPYSR